jgi:hypothetical protein
MTRFDSCRWAPVNEPSLGHVTAHRGLVIHRRSGVSGPNSFWFCTPSDHLHATFSVDLDGQPTQHIDDDERPVLLGLSGHGYALAEVAGTGALSPPQVYGLACIYAEGHRHYGWPLTVALAPGEAGLLSHGSGGLSFAAHPNCPGPDLMGSLNAVITRVRQLLDPATTVRTMSPTNAAGQAEADPDQITAASAPEDGGSPELELVSGVPQTRISLAAQAGWGRRWLPH